MNNNIFDKDIQKVHALAVVTAKSFDKYGSGEGLAVAMPQVVRAGVAGGLPFDSLTGDLFSGCLSAAKICYGECFAARQAYENARINFGKRVKNIVDPTVLAADLSAISKEQGFVRNGWNSDISWGWNDSEALVIAKLIHAADKHPVLLTKAFKPLTPQRMDEFAALGVELRVCVSAFDASASLHQRIHTMQQYRERGGLSVAVLMSAKFKDPSLSERQDRIVDHLLALDLPSAENSIRFSRNSPVLSAIDVSACGTVVQSGDVWAGRLYPQKLSVPTLSSVPKTYRGVAAFRSRCDTQLLEQLFFDPVPTNELLRATGSASKPHCAGVPKSWE